MKKEYSIGEISKIYNLGIDSLRYYEKKGILKPKRKESLYRVYSLDDIYVLNILKDLRKLGFSTKQIKEYLENRNMESTLTLLEKEIKLIKDEMETLGALEKKLESRLKSLTSLKNENYFDKIIIKDLEERKILAFDRQFETDDEIDLALRQLETIQKKDLLLFANKNIGAFISKKGIMEKNYRLYSKAFLLLDDDSLNYNFLLAKSTYIILRYKGSYEKSQSLFEKIFAYIEKNNYQLNGFPLEIYQVDIHDTDNEDEFITEIQVPIKK